MNRDSVIRIIKKNEFISIALCVVLTVILSLTSGVFWTGNNLDSLQASIAPIAIMAFGMMILLICGYFDLSIGSIMLFAGILSGKLCMAGVPVPLTILIVLASGAVFGCLNGFLVSILGINALIATIGVQFMGYGVSMTFWDDMKQFTQNTKLPDSFIAIGEGKVLGLYYMTIILIVLLIAFWFFLKHTPSGRSLYYLGGNKEAAKMMGYSDKSIVFKAYVVTGFLAALAGVLSVARIQSPTQYMGSGVHMTCIIACVVGGGSFAGGKGSALGAVMGVAFMSLLTNMFNLLELTTQLQNVIVGLILVAVIVIDGYVNLKKMREMGKI